MSDEAAKAQGYEDLFVWQKGIALVKEVYRLTKTLPDDEKFGLVAQMRRAAVSIPSNIAEGQARAGTREFMRFISHAEGSTAELDTLLVISLELGYTNDRTMGDLRSLVGEERKMLNGLRRSLKLKLLKQKKRGAE